MNLSVCQRQTLEEMDREVQASGVPELPEIVARHITDQRLLRRRQKVLVAVSGGLDSMVLLNLLVELSGRYGWRLGVVHVNHRLRGRASGADARFVRRAAESLDVPCWIESRDVRQQMRPGVSLEMVAREVRHNTIAEVAKRQRYRSVTLAHHRDDQVEQFFLRLFRGAGSEGLSGMKALNCSPVDRGLTLVRPLLEVPRSELEEFARRRGIRYRVDVSNQDADILRNRIRHKLIPLLEDEYQPGLSKVVPRAMALMRDEANLLKELANEGAWPDLALPLKRLRIRQQLNQAGVAADFKLVERLVAGEIGNAEEGRSFQVSVSGGLNELCSSVGQFSDAELTIDLRTKSAKCCLSGLGITFRRWRRRPRAAVGLEVFDAGEIGDEIRLRHWRKGDRFQPIGMSKPVKLQDLFVNAKVPRAERHRRVVAENQRGVIFWVEGLRIGEVAKIRSSTRSFLEFRWVRDSSAGPADSMQLLPR